VPTRALHLPLTHPPPLSVPEADLHGSPSGQQITSKWEGDPGPRGGLNPHMYDAGQPYT
jgi:hypothetical protein